MNPARPTLFTGLWIPIITPFTPFTPITPFIQTDSDGVDHTALGKLVRHYKDCGASGFVACGTTGEAAALSKAEQQAVLGTVLANAGDLPVAMGVGGYNLPEAISAAQAACAQGAKGLLVAAPNYIRPSQAGICEWFERIADACSAPIIIYDVPYRTGVEMTLQTLQRLAQHPNIQAIKDCGGNAGKTQQLIADGQLQVMAGEDHQIFATVAAGGSGAITASAHMQTAQFVKVIRLLLEGRSLEAQAVWRPLVPLISEMFSEPNPAVIKKHLAQEGRIENRLRAPMQTASA
jgi:4-hydroxy-tetrahydrodipicolinate synthase